METNVRTPQLAFGLPQRLVVPLFQRPYRWDEERHWAPLWEDVTLLANPLANGGHEEVPPHFLGAIVLQMSQSSTGTMPSRDVIDGQQRLTTLQVLLSALRGQLEEIGATNPAARLANLTENEEHYHQVPEDRYKIWPIEQDRAAFVSVMEQSGTLEYEKLPEPDHAIVRAHRFFSAQAAEWLQDCGSDDERLRRAEALESAVRMYLNLVVIDLSTDDDPQAIFETLNARGTPLTPADLIKNLMFRRLIERNIDIQSAHDEYWGEFETPFWTSPVAKGSEITVASKFFNYYLISQLGDFIKEQQTFDGWKRHLLSGGADPVALMGHLKRSAVVYKAMLQAAGDGYGGAPTPLETFSYRMKAMNVEAVRPLMLKLLDPDLPPLAPDVEARSLMWIESWIVRRMLAGAGGSSYLKLLARLAKRINEENREHADEVIAEYFMSEGTPSSYWPDDDEIRRSLKQRAILEKAQVRVRMILEALEDNLRGYDRSSTRKHPTEQPAPRNLTIEHLMPSSWVKNWPLPVDGDENERKRHVELIGNLTLLTGKTNSSMSNGPWAGSDGKLEAIRSQSILRLNQEVAELGANGWSENEIDQRTDLLTERILKMWPVPQGHKIVSPVVGRRGQRRHHDTTLTDLLTAGLLVPSDVLDGKKGPRSKIWGQAIVLHNGTMEIETGEAFDNPSPAAMTLLGTESPINGWRFWYHGPSGKTLAQLREVFEDSSQRIVESTDELFPSALLTESLGGESE